MNEGSNSNWVIQLSYQKLQSDALFDQTLDVDLVYLHSISDSD